MTEGTATSATPASTASNVRDGKTESLVDTLFDVGMGWAAHGLTIGKLALLQSAKTLETTAKTLEKLAAELDKKDSTKA